LSPAAVTGPSKKNREKESGKKGGGEEKEKDQALFKLLQVSIDTASADLGMPLGRKRSDLGQRRRRRERERERERRDRRSCPY
jgi:hypothetical protein